MAERPAGSRDDSSVINPEPAHLAFLMGNINKLRTSAPRGHYPKAAARPTRKPHNFSPTQLQAFNFFKLWISAFNDNFSETELKKAFRQAALLLHPDRGGNVEQFLELKTNHEILKGLFQAKET